MSRGGARSGAGRKRGQRNEKTKLIAEQAKAAGLTPLEFMLNVLRDVSADPAARMDAAKAAAPYIHPKLANVDLKAQVDQTTKVYLLSGDDDL